jgi:hypothetical protein
VTEGTIVIVKVTPIISHNRNLEIVERYSKGKGHEEVDEVRVEAQRCVLLRNLDSLLAI